MYNVNKRIWISLLLAGGLVACSSSVSSGQGNDGGKNNLVDERIPGVFISQSSMMPVDGNSGQVFYVVAHNDTDQTVTLKEISATNSGSSSQTKTDGASNSLYNAGACTSPLAPGQSCLIGITPQGRNGGFVLNADFLSASGAAYNARQVLNYGTVPANGGFRVNSDNLHVTKPSGQNYYIAVPFVLNQDYTKVDVTTQITPVSKKILCSNANYTQGTSCTAILEYAAGNYSGKITLSGTTGTLKSTHKLTGLSANDASSVNFSATTELVPNLIHNGYNALVGGKTVSIVNTGLAPLTLTDIVSSNGTLLINRGDCTNGTTLAVGATCSFSLSTTTTTHTNGTVTINYGGKSSTFNVYEIAPASAPGITLTSSGSLDYTELGQTNSVAITVQNPSQTTVLNDLNFTGIASPFVLERSGCASSLAVGASCNLVLHYTPTAANDNANLQFSASASYVESNGKTGSIAASKIDIHYSSVLSLATLTVTPAIPVAMQIRADGESFVTQDFIIHNDGNTDAPSLQVASDATLPLPIGATISSDGCSNTVLSAGQSCPVTIKFGPTLNALAATVGNFVVSYKDSLRSDAATKTQNSQNITFQASNAALIVTESDLPSVTATDPSAGLTPAGTDSYAIYPTLGKRIILSYVYKNIGTDAANSFNVAVNFPGVTTGGDCPTGNVARSLAAGASCTLALEYVDDAYFQAFGYGSAAMFSRPAFSYLDKSSAGQDTLVTGALGSRSVAVNLLPWADLTPSVASLDAASHTVTLNFDLKTLQTAVASGPVTISLPKLAQEGFDPAVSNSSCQVDAGGNCSMTVAYYGYTPAGKKYIEWSALPTSGAALNSALGGKIEVTLP